MQHIIEVFLNGYKNYGGYLWREITHPSMHNYVYWLIGVSLFFLILEWLRPWRETQPKFRKDFWLDAFYMFFNFFIFSLIIYNAASDVIVDVFNHGIIATTGIDLQAMNPLRAFPAWAILLIGFVVRDFIQWLVHQLLHRVPRLWEFHKVHHSVRQMGFAAHLRFHWMETIVYRIIEYIPLALLGIGLYDFFVIHIFALAVGHYNHSNLSVSGYLSAGIIGTLVGFVCANGLFEVSLFEPAIFADKLLIVSTFAIATSIIFGPFMKYLFNSPEMHIWHHAHDFPTDRSYGMNFGLTLSLWDWLFGTAWVPSDGKNIPLGFPGVQQFPDTFIAQVTHGFRHSKSTADSS